VAIPALNSAGLLPEGIHPATLGEVEESFGRSSDTRAALYSKLCAFLDLARSFDVFTSIVIDGSFVTDKAAPNDIDAVLILPGAKLKGLMGHADYLKLDNPEVKAKFAIDLFIEPGLDGMAIFFQKLKTEDALQRGVGPRQRRGVVEVTL
jgi:hypothetical protein